MSIPKIKNDDCECARIELAGATERLLMILQARSEINYALAIEVVERKIVQFREIHAAHGTPPAHG